MIVGVDFDNTLVCYDGLFREAAAARGWLPSHAPHDKNGVRDWLIREGREDRFTLLQGEVYGPGLVRARAYPGARDCLVRLKAAGARVVVVSHKTRYPVAGPSYDLRRAAREWLVAQEILSTGLLMAEDVFFEDTMSEKAERIKSLGCTHFIDDMERFLVMPGFPDAVTRLWFTPAGDKGRKDLRGYPSWSALATYFAESV